MAYSRSTAMRLGQGVPTADVLRDIQAGITPPPSGNTLVGWFADLWSRFVDRAQEFLSLSRDLTLLKEQYQTLYREAAAQGRTDVATEVAAGASQVDALREEAGPVVEFIGRWLPTWQSLASRLGLRGTSASLGQLPVAVTIVGLVAAIGALTYVMVTKLNLLAERDRLVTGLQALRDKLLTPEQARDLGLTISYPGATKAQGWGAWFLDTVFGIPRWVIFGAAGAYGLLLFSTWQSAPSPVRRRR